MVITGIILLPYVCSIQKQLETTLEGLYPAATAGLRRKGVQGKSLCRYNDLYV